MECERRGLLYRGSPNNVEVRLYMAASRHHTNGANIQNCNQPQGKDTKYDDAVHFGAENLYSGGAFVSVCSWNEKKKKYIISLGPPPCANRRIANINLLSGVYRVIPEARVSDSSILQASC